MPKVDFFIAKTILQQIRSIDRMALPAWGITHPKFFAPWHKNNLDKVVSMLTWLVWSSNKDADVLDTIAFSSNDVGRIVAKSRGGVILKVRGSKLRGYVLVSLSGLDLYDIVGGTIRNGQWKTKETKRDIYAEDLVSILDGVIG